ncbi:MAG: HAMP domain-containing sensor histidine kinase, partial [Oscillospiraceae bacterium]|nr:HAMP domain-containing sensor histidine kinase [Oscillospiraceae bacterium]
ITWASPTEQLIAEQTKQFEDFVQRGQETIRAVIENEKAGPQLYQRLNMVLDEPPEKLENVLSIIYTPADGANILAAAGAGNLHTPFAALWKKMSLNYGKLYTLQGDSGENYIYIRHFAQTADGKRININFFQEIDIDAAEKKQIEFFYLVLSVSGIGLLFVLSYLLMGVVLLPVKRNMRRQKEFVAAASHELKSPLSVMKAVMPLLPQNEYTPILQQETDRMSHLVSDLLTLAGGDAAKWKMSKRTVDADTLLVELYERYLPRVKEAGLDFQLQLPQQPLPPLLGDKERLQQLFCILLDNALSYGADGRQICLGAQSAGRYLRIWVSDHGKGVPREQREKIFERFFRASESRTDKMHFGLGLCVARELTALHRGTVWEEETPGGGATFVVLLPHMPERQRFQPSCEET